MSRRDGLAGFIICSCLMDRCYLVRKQMNEPQRHQDTERNGESKFLEDAPLDAISYERDIEIDKQP